jgi:hypothetical protein
MGPISPLGPSVQYCLGAILLRRQRHRQGPRDRPREELRAGDVKPGAPPSRRGGSSDCPHWPLLAGARRRLNVEEWMCARVRPGGPHTAQASG